MQPKYERVRIVAELDEPNRLSDEEMTFAAQVRALREERGWTQADLVDRIKSSGLMYMNQSTLSRIENGTRPVRLMESQVLSRIYDRPVTMMIDPHARNRLVLEAESVVKAINRSAMTLNTSAKEVLSGKISAQKYMNALDRLAEQIDDMEPDVREKLKNVRRSVKFFATIDLTAGMAARVAEFESKHSPGAITEHRESHDPFELMDPEKLERENWTYNHQMPDSAFNRFVRLINEEHTIDASVVDDHR